MGVVWTAPCGAPGATFTGEMVHNAGRGTRLIDLQFPAIGNNNNNNKKIRKVL